MSTQLNSGAWTEDGSDLLSQPVLNFFARRRIAISLIGFTSLAAFNLLVMQNVPRNPFLLSDGWSAGAMFMLMLGLFIRSWSSGTLDKSRSVTQQGPYALTRNPLYIGSFLMMAGFCILLRDLPTLLFVIGPMALLYRMQIHFEEKRLLFLFPTEWPLYVQKVSRIVPTRWSAEAFKGWSVEHWRRNREYVTLLATLCGIVLVYGWYLIAQIWLPKN